jgi:hypothetical protein
VRENALMRRLMLALVVVLAACGGPAPTAAPTPAFDLAAVKANFTDECKDPMVVDDLFCEQVKVARMTADGEILNVPTTLNAASRERAEAICRQLTFAHFGAEGKDLGYRIVGVLDQDGGNAAACTVD